MDLLIDIGLIALFYFFGMLAVTSIVSLVNLVKLGPRAIQYPLPKCRTPNMCREAGNCVMLCREKE